MITARYRRFGINCGRAGGTAAAAIRKIRRFIAGSAILYDPATAAYATMKTPPEDDGPYQPGTGRNAAPVTDGTRRPPSGRCTSAHCLPGVAALGRRLSPARARRPHAPTHSPGA